MTYSYTLSIRNLRNALLVGLGGFALFGFAILDGWEIRVFSGSLPPALARYIYIVLVGIMAFLVGFAVLAKSLGTRTVALDDTTLQVPKGELSKAMLNIPLREIERFEVTTYGDIHTLVLRYSGGEVKLRSPHFESFEAFTHFFDAFVQRYEIVHSELRPSVS
jgi:hypothetical protein